VGKQERWRGLGWNRGSRRPSLRLYRARWGRRRHHGGGDGRDLTAATIMFWAWISSLSWPVGVCGWDQGHGSQRRSSAVLKGGRDVELAVGVALSTPSERKKTMVFFWPVGPPCWCDTETVCWPGFWWAGLLDCASGPRSGKLFFTFFLLSFLFYLLFQLSNLNSIYLQDFEFGYLWNKFLCSLTSCIAVI
jgi:hypothetical protein